jgi:hypothetical protein
MNITREPSSLPNGNFLLKNSSVGETDVVLHEGTRVFETVDGQETKYLVRPSLVHLPHHLQPQVLDIGVRLYCLLHLLIGDVLRKTEQEELVLPVVQRDLLRLRLPSLASI